MIREVKLRKPIKISEELAKQYTNPDQFERFDTAMRTILGVSHSEIVRREAKQVALHPRRRGRKPKTSVSPGPGGQPQA